MERAKEAFLIARVVYNPTCVRWDYSSIFHILHHWLGRMEDVQRKDTLHLHSDRRADEIKLCILLLNRICKSDYEEMALKPHDDFWGEIHTWSTPSKDMPGYYQWNSARPNVKTPEQMKQERDEFRRAMKHADYLRNQDIELLFKTIRKHHGGWWT